MIPRTMLFDMMDGKAPAYGIKVPKDERGDVFRIEIAKAIYSFVMKYRKLIIRLDYDGKLLLKVDSPEEFMIDLDLMG